MNKLLAIFVTGSVGQSVLLAVVLDGKFSGADLFGGLADGVVEYTKNEFQLELVVRIPSGVDVVQGITAPDGGLEYTISAVLPEDFLSQPFVKIPTPYGSVHARFQVLREL